MKMYMREGTSHSALYPQNALRYHVGSVYDFSQALGERPVARLNEFERWEAWQKPI